MQIHNFLSDLLVSIRLLIDDHLFPHLPGMIKSYEFNLGNRTFQLGPEPTTAYALPAAIVNIQDEAINFGGRRSDLIQQGAFDNINKIPVLYNVDNQITVYVHEEHTVVPFSIFINCESQMQAKEIAYHIKKTLPLYKNVNILEFTTFIEIDNKILFEVLNYNILLDQISNLYTKINHNTGNVEYCFSLTHKPLIRLDSVITSISDTSQSTFQVQIELAYVIPFPMFLIIDQYSVIENINLSFNITKFPIVMFPLRNLINDSPSDQKVDRALILDSEDTYYPSGVIISKTETQVFISIQFHVDDFIIDNTIYKYRFKKVNIVSQDLVPEYYYAEENKIVFIMSLEDYEIWWLPTSTVPLFIEFYKDL